MPKIAGITHPHGENEPARYNRTSLLCELISWLLTLDRKLSLRLLTWVQVFLSNSVTKAESGVIAVHQPYNPDPRIALATISGAMEFSMHRSPYVVRERITPVETRLSGGIMPKVTEAIQNFIRTPRKTTNADLLDRWIHCDGDARSTWPPTTASRWTANASTYTRWRVRVVQHPHPEECRQRAGVPRLRTPLAARPSRRRHRHDGLGLVSHGDSRGVGLRLRRHHRPRQGHRRER